MSIQIKLKNSVVQDSTPSTSDLPEVGELAVNGNINSIGGFMRASNNTIVKIFGPGSVTTPTATTTVSGISELATNSETTTGTATNRVVTPAGLNAVTVAERTTSNTNYVAKAGSTLTGVLTMPNGSNSAPAINFGDSDSGIFGGTNTVSLAAGGTTRLTADTGVTITGALSVSNNISTSGGQITCGVHGTSGIQMINDGTFGTIHSADLVLRTAATERARLDTSGRLLVGTSTARSPANIAASLQVEGTDAATSSISITRNSANSNSANLIFNKSRGAAVGSDTVVQNNDTLGIIGFAGNDGTDSNNAAAHIVALVDGTPGANDMPGRLEFKTTADGAASPTTRLTIDSAGTATFTGNITTTGQLFSSYATLTAVNPTLTFSDSNNDPDYTINVNSGVLKITDSTNSADRLVVNSDGHIDIAGNLDVGAGLDVTGNITGTGDLTIDSGVLHVDSTNNRVGINTTTPAGLLDLRDTSGASITVRNTGTVASIALAVGTSTNQVVSRGANSSTARDLSFILGTTEAVRIDSSGRMLIGTTTEGFTEGDDLTIKSADHGGITIRTPSTKEGNIAFSDATSGTGEYSGLIRYRHANDDLAFWTASNLRLLIDSSGNVGIGHTAPTGKLDVGGTINVGNVGSNTSATNNLIQGYGYRIGAALYGNVSIRSTYTSNTNSGSLDFYTASGGQSTAERMRITPSGNVGIGTTSPSNFLEIDGGSTASTQIVVDGSGRYRGLEIHENGTRKAYFHHDATDNKALLNTAEGILAFATGDTERMRIDSAGKVGIGTTSPAALLTLNVDTESNLGSGSEGIRLTSGSSNAQFVRLGSSYSNNSVTGPGTLLFSSNKLSLRCDNDNPITFHTGSTVAERMRLTSAGLLGIGTTSPNFNVEVAASGGGDGATLGISNTGADPAGLRLNSGHGNWSVYNSKTIGDALEIRDETSNSTRMIINSSGDVGIGTTSPTTGLHVNGSARVNQFLVNTSGVHNSARITVVGHTTGSHSNIQCQNSDGTQLFLVRNDNHTFVGTLSKSAGSFFIDHPLPSLAATKTLRHSFIEGPQCDNIYRGKVTLSSGTASINLDTVSKMTEGTFVVLNRDVQCFTTNETGFDSVKGSVENNILTIICENNSSTDTISWMVVGERQDPSIKTAGITDDEGYLLVEEDKVAV